MFTNFRSQFLWCIVCTFLSGVCVGGTVMMFENNEPIKPLIVFVIFTLAILVLNVLYWKNIFSQIKLNKEIINF